MAILSVNGTGINDDRHKVRTWSVVSDDKLRRENSQKRADNSRAVQIQRTEFVA
jgi:hypothetical protein